MFDLDFNIGDSTTSNSVDVTFFFNSTETDTVITVTENLDSANDQPSSVRVAGPDGETIHWSIRPQFSDNRHTLIGDAPVATSELTHTITIPATTGIYKVVCKAFDSTSFNISANNDIDEWGMFMPSGQINQDVFGLSTAYIFVPGEAGVFYFEGNDSISITDSSLVSIPGSDGSDEETNVDIVNPNAGSDDVWIATLGGTWSLEHYATPMVFCNSLAAANSIRSGTIKNGLDFFWSKDDQLLHERLVTVTNTLASTDHTTVVQTFDDAVTLWPDRHIYYGLMTLYPQMFYIIHTCLKRQDLRTSEYRLGFMSDTDTPSSTIPIWGDSNIARGELFGFFYAWNDAGNPYYNDVELGKRAVIGMLGECRRIQGYRIRNTYSNSSSRLGSVGLEHGGGIASALFYNYEGSNISNDDITAMMPSLIEQMDTIFAGYYTSTRNQDSINLPLFVMFSKLWEMRYGNDNATALCLEESAAITATDDDREVPLEEAVGYDGSYCGIQNFEISVAYTYANRASEWSFLKDAIARNYEWWSHFIMPSASGYGTFAHDSCSRTTLGSLYEQFTGAQYLMVDVVPIVARWTRLSGKYENLENQETELADYITDVNNDITNETDNESLFEIRGSMFNSVPLWQESIDSMPASDILLPCEESASQIIITEDDNDIIEIQTPNYYAAIPTFIPGDFYYQDAYDQHKVPRDIETDGGDFIDTEYSEDDRGVDSEEIGGVGLSCLYSKTTNRPVISGRNISPFSTHQIVVIDSNGEKMWNDPGTRSISIDQEEKSITIGYKMFDSGITVTKKMTFRSNKIDILNRVVRKPGSDIVKLREYIPLCSTSRILNSAQLSKLQNTVKDSGSSVENDIGNDIFINADLANKSSFAELTYTSGVAKEGIAFAYIEMDVPAEGGDTQSTYSITLPGNNLTALYLQISRQYGEANTGIVNATNGLYGALEAVIQIDDPDVKMELLGAFRDVYTAFEGSSLDQNLLSSVRRFNTYILRSSNFETINDFLETNNILVSTNWASISDLSGHPIDVSYISDD